MMEQAGWDWDSIDTLLWEQVSEEFLPTALGWSRSYRTALDIGAGVGRHALLLAKLGMEVTAADLSESSVRIIREKSGRGRVKVRAVRADMRRLPFPDGCFECVVCFHTIYRTDFAGMEQALGEIGRLLVPGGQAYLTFNSKENPSYQAGERIDGNTVRKLDGMEQGRPRAYVDTGELLNLLAPFLIVKMQKITTYLRNQRPERRVHYYVLVQKRQ